MGILFGGATVSDCSRAVIPEARAELTTQPAPIISLGGSPLAGDDLERGSGGGHNSHNKKIFYVLMVVTLIVTITVLATSVIYYLRRRRPGVVVD